ncbi:MAG: hypothetical protein ACLFS7_01460 [Desulfosudaceae bacterium]
MARLCAAQGHNEKSAEIYSYLLKANPGNREISQALAEVTGQARESAPPRSVDVPDQLQAKVNRWVSLLVERDLKRRFDQVRHQLAGTPHQD